MISQPDFVKLKQSYHTCVLFSDKYLRLSNKGRCEVFKIVISRRSKSYE